MEKMEGGESLKRAVGAAGQLGGGTCGAASSSSRESVEGNGRLGGVEGVEGRGEEGDARGEGGGEEGSTAHHTSSRYHTRSPARGRAQWGAVPAGTHHTLRSTKAASKAQARGSQRWQRSSCAHAPAAAAGDARNSNKKREYKACRGSWFCCFIVAG